MKLKAPVPDWSLEEQKPAEELFTDREAPRKAFWDVYHGMEADDITAVSYYGVGGIGKTTLLKKLGREMEEQLKNGKADYVYLSLEGNNFKDDILYNLSRQMMIRNKGMSFPLFDAAFAKIASDEGKDISSYEQAAKQKIMDSEFLNIASTVLGDAIPLGGSIALGVEYLLSFGAKMKEKRDRESNAAIYTRIATSSVAENRADLQRYFTTDAYRVFRERERPFVIFLDGYENLVNYVEQSERAAYEDAWVRDLERGLVLIPNTLWVIAGREKLAWPEELLPVENSHRIGNLSETDAVNFFRKSGLDDEKLTRKLYQLTNGTPIFMDLCVETFRAVRRTREPKISDFGRNTDELAKRYLKGMDREQQWVLSVIAAFPNIWTDDMAEQVLLSLAGGTSLRILKDFMKLSLIEKMNYGNRLHETIRQIINKNTDPEELLRIRSKVAEYLLGGLRSSRKSEYRLEQIKSLCELLENGGLTGLSASDFARVTEITKEEIELCGDFNLGVELTDTLRMFAGETGLPAEMFLTAANPHCKYTYSAGRYGVLDALAEENLQYAKEHLPENHPEALTALLNSSIAYSAKGNYLKAMELRRLCYEKRLETLGAEHTDTLYALRQWASSCTDLRRNGEALALKEKCYEGYRKLLGEDAEDTLMALNNLANSCAMTGDYERAVSLFQKCYEKRVNLLGKEHPYTLMTLSNLANACDASDPQKALALREECLAARTRVLGPDHPNTLRSMNNLAVSKAELGLQQEAFELRRNCLDARIRIFGSDSVLVYRAKNNLANSYALTGNPEEAGKLYEECLNGLSRLLGGEHYDTDQIRENRELLSSSAFDARRLVSFLEWE